MDYGLHQTYNTDDYVDIMHFLYASSDASGYMSTTGYAHGYGRAFLIFGDLVPKTPPSEEPVE